MWTLEETEEIGQLSQLSMESITGMLSYHVDFSGTWLKQNTLWPFQLDNYYWTSTLYSLVWKETPATLATKKFIWVVTPDFPNSQQTDEKSSISCPNFGESRFPGSSRIPDLVQIFIVFPIPAPYLGQIPDPENTLPDPVEIKLRFQISLGYCGLCHRE